MKKVLVTLTVLTVLALGAGAFAFGPGWFGGGPMMGYGTMGPGMMGYYGGGTWCTGPGSCFTQGAYGPAYNSKFLEETKDLRKQLNDKRFEYFEALRNPETKPETITKLQKEIWDLQQKIYEKAPRTAYRGGFGPYGVAPCWQ